MTNKAKNPIGVLDRDEIQNIPLALISPDSDQPRKELNREALDDLVRSIKRLNLRTVLTVRPNPRKNGHYLIVRGERRWRALKEAGAEQTTCLVFQTEDMVRLHEEMLMDEHYQQRLTPLEKALAYQTIIQRKGWSADQLALNFPPLKAETIRKALALLKLDPEVQAMVQNRTVGVQAAGELLKVKPTQQRKLAERIVAEDLGLAAVKQQVKTLVPRHRIRSRTTEKNTTDVIHLSRRHQVSVKGDANMERIDRLRLLVSAIDNTVAEILAERGVSNIHISNKHLGQVFQSLHASTAELQSYAVEASSKLGRVLLILLYELRNADSPEVRREWVGLLNSFPAEVKSAINALRRK